MGESAIRVDILLTEKDEEPPEIHGKSDQVVLEH